MLSIIENIEFITDLPKNGGKVSFLFENSRISNVVVSGFYAVRFVSESKIQIRNNGLLFKCYNNSLPILNYLADSDYKIAGTILGARLTEERLDKIQNYEVLPKAYRDKFSIREAYFSKKYYDSNGDRRDIALFSIDWNNAFEGILMLEQQINVTLFITKEDLSRLLDEIDQFYDHASHAPSSKFAINHSSIAGWRCHLGDLSLSVRGGFDDVFRTLGIIYNENLIEPDLQQMFSKMVTTDVK